MLALRKFNKKENEQQFKVNQEVLKTSKTAITTLEGNNVERAKELLKEGTILINRQKLIKLADKSEYRWNTIQEYVDDDLADNEADSKKIKIAEKRANVSKPTRRKRENKTSLQVAISNQACRLTLLLKALKCRMKRPKRRSKQSQCLKISKALRTIH